MSGPPPHLIDQLQLRAQERLTANAYDYYVSGADDESTLTDNSAAWQRLRLRPHVLRDVATIDLTTTVLGTSVSLPVLIAPTAYHKLADPDGEVATARAAQAADTLMIVSTLATVSLEDVAETVPDSKRWYQLYIFSERSVAKDLLQRAGASGYGAIVLTVDAPILGRRRRDAVNQFVLPDGMQMANLHKALASDGGSGLEKLFSSHDQSLTVDDLAWIRETSGLPLVVKGVHRGDDARAIADAGADAIVVSNHGGRQLDTAVATADVLAEVVDAVDGQAEVYVDGGIRRGTDVLKALALGARAVLIGRPVLWGLAADGTAGVTSVIDGFRDELERAMKLSGVASVGDVPRDLL